MRTVQSSPTGGGYSGGTPGLLEECNVTRAQLIGAAARAAIRGVDAEASVLLLFLRTLSATKLSALARCAGVSFARSVSGHNLKDLSVLVIGAGIGGLTAAIALRQRGFAVQMIEKDPVWSVYGVGIIQQGNVLRAVHALGILDRYIDAGAGFDAVEVTTLSASR